MLRNKSILLVDSDDLRRETRIALLESRGMQVAARNDSLISGLLDHERVFDLMIVAVHREDLPESTAYVRRVHKTTPGLPILSLTDEGVFVKSGSSGEVVRAGNPREFLDVVCDLLTRSLSSIATQGYVRVQVAGDESFET